jgi:hypothetical protein
VSVLRVTRSSRMVVDRKSGLSGGRGSRIPWVFTCPLPGHHGTYLGRTKKNNMRTFMITKLLTLKGQKKRKKIIPVKTNRSNSFRDSLPFKHIPLTLPSIYIPSHKQFHEKAFTRKKEVRRKGNEACTNTQLRNCIQPFHKMNKILKAKRTVQSYILFAYSQIYIPAAKMKSI